MRAQTQWAINLTWMIVMLAGGGTVLAQKGEQEKAPTEERDVIVQKDVTISAPEPGEHVRMPFPPAGVGGGNTFVFLSSEMSFDGKTVKGAPYSAQAVTEFTQTLGDGNRITRRNTASVYRDSEGRTRREQSLSNVGPWATANEPKQIVFINDPVEGVSYILEPQDRTARKVGLPKVEILERKPGEVPAEVPEPVRRKMETGRVFEAMPAMPRGAIGAVAGGTTGSVVHFEHNGAQGEGKKESLGKQTIDGIEAEGTRITHTIPAGEIGNEQPINTVHETWYSPELQAIVMSKSSDPRSGETVYRLTNIVRDEPARSLFEVPSDYTVKDDQPEIRRFEVKRPRSTE
jgi:hypothetical protein